MQTMNIQKVCLIVCVVIPAVLMWNGTSSAVSVNGAPIVISGGTVTAGAGGEALAYSAQLQDAAELLISIAVQIDGAGGSPITAPDIDRLRLYADANANGTLEIGTDIFLGEQLAVGVGAMTTVSDATPSEAIGGVARWFFVSIRFNDPSAAGKSFTVRAVTPPDNITGDPPPPGAPFSTADGAIGPGASVLVLTGGAGGGLVEFGRPIPVGLEWVAGLGFFGYGAYRLLRRRRGNTAG